MMVIKKIILTSISKYEKEEKNKTHFIRGQTKEIKENENNIKENLLDNNNLINSENNNDMNENNNENLGDDINNKKSEKKKYVELSDMKENNN